MSDYSLDPRLEADTLPISRLGLSELRLMNDCRWPWVMLVPQRAGIVEMFDLTPLDQTMLTFECGLAAEALKKATGCRKINIGALGNVVSQFHLHLIARNEGDENWPGPVWGHGTAQPWEKADRDAFIATFLGAF
jgi:diadenosine tetraphosphate (Ap4A) HIT family hydrolase